MEQWAADCAAPGEQFWGIGALLKGLTTGPITLITSGNYTEKLSLLLTESPLASVVLGHPWLVCHNQSVDWGHSSISAWSDLCYASCFTSACSSLSCSLLQNEPVYLSNVPKEYLDLKEVFSKSRAASLPPHRPYDCAIDLVAGMSPPSASFVHFEVPETKRDDGSSMLLEEGEVTEHLRDHICGPF